MSNAGRSTVSLRGSLHGFIGKTPLGWPVDSYGRPSFHDGGDPGRGY